MRFQASWLRILAAGSLALALFACGDDDGVILLDGSTGGLCTEGQVLCEGACTDTQSSQGNCGACGNACAAGLVCDMGACMPNCASGRTECDGGCIDLNTDINHCGACGTACSFSNADGACVTGECIQVRCEPGFADCDGTSTNGCERDTMNDRRHCGGCGSACPFGGSCDAGTCDDVSSPASLAGDNFSVLELSTTCSVVDHEPITGDDNGGIAVTPTRFFITGDSDTVVMSAVDLTGQTGVGTVLDGMIGDIRAGKVYLMTDSTGDEVDGPGDDFEQLVELDDTGARTATTISLSTPLTTGGGMVFSGPGFGVLYDGNTTLHRVDFADGNVTELSTTLEIDNCDNTENWADYGVAEFFEGGVHLLYPTCRGIERVSVDTGMVTTLLADNIDDLHSFTFEPTQSRWYWHHEDRSTLGSRSDENGGFCEALWSDSACGPDPQRALCDSSCIDVSEDVANCGACGNACGAGATCDDGICDTCAEANLLNCAGTCVDAQSDAMNCGACGTTCGGDTRFCVRGTCSSASPSCRETGSTSGIFTLAPVGAEPFQVYCENDDLAGQGGGWTLLGVFTNNDDVNSWTPLDVNWTQATTFGDSTDPTVNADAKSAAFNTLPIDQLAIVRDGVVQVVSATDCVDGATLLSVMQTDSQDDSDCAQSCPTIVRAGDWANDSDQRDELAFRCDDGDGGNRVDGFSFSDDDNSMITTLDNEDEEDSNFGLGAGEGGEYADWDNSTDDSADDGDRTQILLYGR